MTNEQAKRTFEQELSAAFQRYDDQHAEEFYDESSWETY